MSRSIALLVMLALAASGCSSGLKRPVQSIDARSDAQGVQHVHVDVHTYYFEPNRIVVHAGHPVELELKNHSWVVPHNFSVADPELELKQGMGPRHRHVVRFTPAKPGEYPFFCAVGSHSKHGMTGTLVVVP